MGSEYLLAIESSCDETAAAVIERNGDVLSSVVATQEDLHEKFGGVVPEIASRAHVERILPVIDEAIQKAGISLQDLTVIAVATHPGLVGSLLVGLTAGKTLAMTLEIPLIAVDHIQAHIYACQMSSEASLYPAVGFVVSGGHTNLYDCQSATETVLMGSTIDDAAGEAFDKVAQILNSGFPGGPAIEKAAKKGNAKAFDFPRTFLDQDRLEFSFSGLKTAVLYAAKGQPGARKEVEELDEQRVCDLAASFQAAVVDVLIGKAEQAIEKTGYRTLCVGGGVAANTLFRERLAELGKRLQIEVVIAPWEYCTDNAAMGAIGWELFDAGKIADLSIDVQPGLVRKAEGGRQKAEGSNRSR